jgi:Holliday junction resolvase RusA-like endonuclease
MADHIVYPISFFLHGPTVTWKRARSNGKRRFSEPKDREYRTRIAWAARHAIGTLPMTWPLTARYALTIHVRNATLRDSDLDNHLKSVKDACNGVVWRDDSQIDRVVVERDWTGEVGMRIDVEVIAMSKPEPARKVRRARAA